MILLVSYDLNKPGKDYPTLYDVLKSGLSWWHYLDSTWVIYTNESTDTWEKKIKAAVDQNDHFIIVDITRRARNGWLPKKAWEWLDEHEKR